MTCNRHLGELRVASDEGREGGIFLTASGRLWGGRRANGFGAPPLEARSGSPGFFRRGAFGGAQPVTP